MRDIYSRHRTDCGNLNKQEGLPQTFRLLVSDLRPICPERTSAYATLARFVNLGSAAFANSAAHIVCKSSSSSSEAPSSSGNNGFTAKVSELMAVKQNTPEMSILDGPGVSQNARKYEVSG